MSPRSIFLALLVACVAWPTHAAYVITTIAGNGSTGAADGRGDGGPATSANLANPGGVAADAAGNIYVSDTGASRIRKINAAGVITTIAGSTAGYGGDSGPATSALL